MKTWMIFCSLSLLIVACGDPNASAGNAEQKSSFSDDSDSTAFSYLDISKVFSLQDVLEFIDNRMDVQSARKWFLSGLDSYKNKKDLDSATYYFKQSLTVQPSANAYYELGNIFFEQKKLKEAMLSYDLAEAMDYEPFSNLLYNKAKVLKLEDKEDQAYRLLTASIQSGYAGFDRIEEDDFWKEESDDWMFKAAIEKGIKGMSNPQTILWNRYKKQFNPLSLPLVPDIFIPYEDQDSFVFISYDFERYVSEMRDAAFSREVGKSIYYYGRLQESEDWTALIYMVRDEYSGGDWFPVSYYLAVYDNTGKLLSKELIAGQVSTESPLIEAKINASRKISIRTFDVVYDMEDYQGTITEKNLVNSYELSVQKDGKLLKSKIKSGEALMANQAK